MCGDFDVVDAKSSDQGPALLLTRLLVRMISRRCLK